MSSSSADQPQPIWARFATALRSEWRELGMLGRVGFLGILISVIVAVGLGFWIPHIATQHLLQARAELMSGIGNQLASEGLLPFGPPGSQSFEELDDQIRLRMVGGETVRVKIWSADGTITYSDDPDLVGRAFGLSDAAVAALSGETSFHISDLSDPAHASERYLGRLIEFYVPLRSADGSSLSLLEVEQSVSELENTRGHIQQSVLTAVFSGLGVLSVFMGALTVASARMLNRRRRDAEHLLSSLFRAQEEERKRTVGALHDDIGQPLYRLLYGLQGTRAKMSEDNPATEELERLETILRDIDRTLRAELRLLHRGVQEDLALDAAIEDLADMTEREAGLQVELRMDPGAEALVSKTGRVALVHAAREGLMNVRKHASAERATVTVSIAPDRVTLDVVDDGTGTSRREGLGIVTLRERLEAIGGGLHVARERGGGTRFSAWVPRRLEGGA